MKRNRKGARAVGLVKLAERTDVRELRGRIRPCLRLPGVPPPGGVELETVPLAPAANRAFGVEELESRIERLAALAALRLPLL